MSMSPTRLATQRLRGISVEHLGPLPPHGHIFPFMTFAAHAIKPENKLRETVSRHRFIGYAKEPSRNSRLNLTGCAEWLRVHLAMHALLQFPSSVAHLYLSVLIWPLVRGELHLQNEVLAGTWSNIDTNDSLCDFNCSFQKRVPTPCESWKSDSQLTKSQ